MVPIYLLLGWISFSYGVHGEAESSEFRNHNTSKSIRENFDDVNTSQIWSGENSAEISDYLFDANPEVNVNMIATEEEMNRSWDNSNETDNWDSDQQSEIQDLRSESEVSGGVNTNDVLQGEKAEICMTPGCVKAAANFLNIMNTDVDPCTDFYEFACGNYIKETVIPKHHSETGLFSELGQKVTERLRKLIESDPMPDDPNVLVSIRNYYHSCMNENKEKLSKQILLEILEKLGGWPLLKKSMWKENKFTWTGIAEKALQFGYDVSFLSIYIQTHPNNSNIKIMGVNEPSLGLDREYLIKGFKNEAVQASYKTMVDWSIYFGAERDTAESELKEVFLMESKIAEITLPLEEKRNVSTLVNLMSVSEANKLYPSINLTSYLNNFLNHSDITINSSEVINIAVPNYVRQLSALMQSVPARIQANYLMLRIIRKSLPFLEESQGWETCIYYASGNDYYASGDDSYATVGSFAVPVGAMYVRKYFPKSSKILAEDMVGNIKTEFKHMLDELDWMDVGTKVKAQLKVDRMKSFIGYSEEILDNNILDKFYKDFVLSSSSFLENYLKMKRFSYEYAAKEFMKPSDEPSWKTKSASAIVDAFYSQNSIQIPAGIIDGVFFQADRPHFMNYGALGSIVGHEITHGFDDVGSQRDGDGRVINWWAPETLNKFKNRTQCMVDQYSNFTVEVKGEVLKVNGVITLGENIADRSGYLLAFRAYNRLAKNTGEENGLPGLPYNPSQLFWLSGASVWCSKSTLERIKGDIIFDPHAPKKFRVNGSFKNIPEFSEAWGCPKDSPMNPVSKCKVW